MSATTAETSASETAANDRGTATTTGTAARRVGRAALLPVLGGALLAAVVLNLGVGAVSIAPGQVLGILADRLGLDVGATWTGQQAAVLEVIRAPRVLMCGLIGAVLAVSGAALQGVFRNPLADPSVIGVSSGAAVGAVAAIVLGAGAGAAAGAGTTGVAGTAAGGLGLALTPIAAFVGGLLAALAVYAMSRREGRTEVVTMVLTGVAVSAICGAFVGLLTFLADDAQLRSIVFWSLGSMGGATWPALTAAGPMLVAAVVLLPLFGRPLNALVLGEREARHLGVDTERVRLAVVGLAALGTGASVSIAGIVGFVGLVTPHLLRLIAGPDHRLLLPASALGGAVLLLAADLAARTVVVPAELPLGVVTALVGGPFFLFLLLRTRRGHGGWG
jgi:iron complex transport system permease protein